MNRENKNVFKMSEEKDKRERIKKAKSKNNFTLINTACLQDPKLSMSSLGMLAYLMSLPSDWEISALQLSKRFNCSKDKVYSTINDLIKYSYMNRYQERDKNGVFGGWITEAADDPNLLITDQNNSQNYSSPHKEKPEAVFSPHKEKPEPVFTGSGKTDATKNLVNNKELKNNNTQEPLNQSKKEAILLPHSGVVVSLMEKLKAVVVSNVLVKHWLKKYGAEYVMEKVDYTLVASRHNPAAFLNRAIREDWKAPLGKPLPDAKKSPSEPVWPSNEENITWYSSLTQKEKEECFKLALTKNEYFGNMINLNGLSFLEQDFMNSTWFKMMMSLIGRAK